jgi:hypothetical protein
MHLTFNVTPQIYIERSPVKIRQLDASYRSWFTRCVSIRIGLVPYQVTLSRALYKLIKNHLP